MRPYVPMHGPTLLDPIGAVIYYLCVTEAIKSGTWTVPSSQKISKMLQLTEGNTETGLLWADLRWLVENGFLFAEHTSDDTVWQVSFKPHSLSQVNVNRRIRKFSPGFGHSLQEEQSEPEERHGRERHMDDREFVEKTITAIRLVAFKDIYISANRHVPQKMLMEFLGRQGFADGHQFYGEGGFLPLMHRIGYIDFPGLPRNEEFSHSHQDQPLLVEPGKVFRYQDMYLELRALDYFSESRADVVQRRRRRKELKRNAEKFVTENQRRPRAS